MNKNSISGNSFRLVKPLEAESINSEVQDENLILHYQKLKEIIEQEIKPYDSKSIGIFIQDSKTGSWLGINEKEGFTPASLLKIPIMMAVLKRVERKEITLKDKITIIEEDLDSSYGNLYASGAGTEITISQLLEEMIVNSDNTASNILMRQLSDTEIDSVFVHVGIPDPYLITNEHKVSPRDYIRMFKSLYYSTYFSPQLSEIALDLTTDTQEENLISKGVPSEIQVAHKFGIFRKTSKEGSELHDCGIIYHQKNPYFLCIMTKNLDFTESQKLIKSISKDTFDFVDKNSVIN